MNRTPVFVVLFAVLAFGGLKLLEPASLNRDLFIFGLLLGLQIVAFIFFNKPNSRNSRNLVFLLLAPTLLALALAVLRSTGWVQVDRSLVWVIFGASTLVVMARALFIEGRATKAR